MENRFINPRLFLWTLVLAINCLFSLQSIAAPGFRAGMDGRTPTEVMHNYRSVPDYHTFCKDEGPLVFRVAYLNITPSANAEVYWTVTDNAFNELPGAGVAYFGSTSPNGLLTDYIYGFSTAGTYWIVVEYYPDPITFPNDYYQIRFQIHVQDKPSITFELADNVICLEDQVQIMNQAGYWGPHGDWSELNWGDGSPVVVNVNGGGGPPPPMPTTHQYSSVGSYIISIKYSNDCGTFTDYEVVTVVPSCNPCQPADFTYSINEHCKVAFSDITTGVASDWQWSFGDGQTASGYPNPEHIYNSPGTYTVVLSVYICAGDFCCWAIYSREIEIDCVPDESCPCSVAANLDFTYDESTCTYTFFDDQYFVSPSSCTAKNVWIWRLNGSVVGGNQPSVTVGASSVGTMCLTVSGDNGYISCLDDDCITLDRVDCQGNSETKRNITNTSTDPNNNPVVFPNPSTGLFTLQRPEERTQLLEVRDLTGRVVFVQSLSSAIETIDLSSLKKGVYLIQLNNEEETTSLRIIKE